MFKTLRLYYKSFKPKEYLFNGQYSEKYSPGSLRNVIQDAAKRASIKKQIKVHSIRHSFASYLVSMDINLIKIQEWLGHSSSKVTEIYCHVLQQKNPIKLVS